MSVNPWSKRFFASTRGRIVTLLRRNDRTVRELADVLDLTGNAIRSQLTKLERDDLVTRTGKRPGTRKPEVVYGLTEEARRLFPQAYDTLLNELVAVLAEQHSAQDMERLLRQVGERLGRRLDRATGDVPVEKRVERACEVLESFGGAPGVTLGEGSAMLRGHRCPFGAVVSEHEEVCSLAEALLAELTGLPVTQQCEREGDRPRCVFAFDTSAFDASEA